MRRLRFLSLRAKLVALSTAVFVLLAGVLLVLSTSRMNAVSLRGADRSTEQLALVLSGSVASGVEFDDQGDVSKALRALDSVPEAVFAEVRRANGSVLASWHGDRVQPAGLELGDTVATAVRDGLVFALAPIRTQGGESASLTLAFSLSSLETEQRHNALALASASLLVLLVAAVACFLIGTFLSRPLTWLAAIAGAVARAIESGDLAAAEKALGGGEQMRARARKLGHMKKRNEVDELTFAFSSLLGSLRDTSVKLQLSAEMLSGAVGQLGHAAEEQSHTVAAQAGALQETQVTAQQIRQTALIAAERAEKVLQVAERAGKIGSSGAAAIEQSLSGLAEIRAQVEGIALKMADLNERTRQIAQITDTVKDLADQSNMLALNAAIEAVRSGEHGKGFAVVAREIRSLADQSIQATGRVRDVLSDVSASIRGAVQITEAGTARMESELQQVRASGENLRELSSFVTDSSEAVREIARTVSQQSSGITQIFSAMADLSRMMETTIKQLDTTNTSITSVKDVSSQVLDVANRFRL